MATITTCIKYMLFYINLLFGLIGLAILIYGGILMYWFRGYSDFVNENFSFIPITVICVGSVTLFVAILGMISSMRINYGLMAGFGAVVVILFALEIVLAICFYFFQPRISNIITSRLEEAHKLYNSDSSVAINWDKLQRTLQCCGLNKKADFKGKTPSSCCPRASESSCSSKNYYDKPCKKAVLNIHKDHAIELYIVGGFLFLIQVVVILGAFFIVYAIRSDYETV